MNVNTFEKYEKHVNWALDNANKYISNVEPDILEMDGMSGMKTRHLYNNICNMDDARYLEIGVWKGSSLCSAMSNNPNLKCLGIDNWSEFGGPKNEFMMNFNKYKVKDAVFLEDNCWNVSTDKIGKFNIYMYDGYHSQEGHYLSIQHFLPCLDDIFIFLVDDWNVSAVEQGTLNSIQNNNLNILYKKEIFTYGRRHPPDGAGPGDRARKYGDWHNGLCMKSSIRIIKP